LGASGDRKCSDQERINAHQRVSIDNLLNAFEGRANARHDAPLAAMAETTRRRLARLTQ